MSEPPSNRGNRGGSNRGRGGQGRGGQGRGDQGRGGHCSQDQQTSQPPAGPSRGRGRGGGGGGGQRDSSPAPCGGLSGTGRGGSSRDDQTRGGHHQGGYRGRGGRGGYSGGDSQRQDTPSHQSRTQSRLPPDESITKLEDSIVTSLSDPTQAVTAKVGNLSLEKSKATDDINLPIRPSYGSKGISAIVTANYFDLRINSPKQLYLYTLDVRHAAGLKAGSEVTGRLRSVVVRAALADLDIKNPWASEFKSQVVSLKLLKLPDSKEVSVQLPPPGNPQGPPQGPVYTVKFTSLQELDPQLLMGWLSNMQENDEKFPKYQSMINALDVIVGHTPRESAVVTAVGRSRFFHLDNTTGQEQNLGDGLKVIIRGFFQSVRPATGRLLLNVNVTHGIFRRSGKLDMLLTAWGLGRMTHLDGDINPQEVRRLEGRFKTYSTFLSKTRVVCELFDIQGNPITVEKTIIGFAVRGDRNGQDPTKPPKFKHRYGGPHQVAFYIGSPGSVQGWNPGNAIGPDGYITVANYFQQRYNLPTQQDLPLVNIGTTKKTVYVPAEQCTVVAGQPLRGHLTGAEAQQMITFACRKPFQNENSILRESRGVLSLNNNARLNAFGITIGQQLLTVHARVLPVPRIVYRKSHLQPQFASWNLNNHLVAHPGPEIKHVLWFYVVRSRGGRPVSEEALKPLTPVFKQFLEFWKNKVGIAISTDPKNGAVLNVRDGSVDEDVRVGILNQLRRRQIPPQGTAPPLAFFVVPDRDNTDLYRAIKVAGDIQLGIHTVCALEKNFKFNPGYVANVGLKVNLKAGGVNHKFSLDLDIVQKGITMFVGYDVIHPTNLPIKSENATSQVGLVISVDQHLSQWPAIAWNQRGGVEMLGPSLAEKFVGRLDLWSSRNKGALPENIVIFRDGVSEGQFEQVITKELPSIRQAYAEVVSKRGLDSNKTARISIIVSVKRHQTRFYPTTNDQNVTMRNGNVMNGTVVDRGVTSARYWDFFLTAHAAIQGTARPARYTVIYDEIFEPDHGKDAADVLEKLTHEMCYLYGRATKAVSICPPAYYADIVCTRARLHHQDQFESSTAGSTASGQTGPSKEVVDRQLHSRIADSMYYI